MLRTYVKKSVTQGRQIRFSGPKEANSGKKWASRPYYAIAPSEQGFDAQR